uniref:F-box/LRR-repeat protein 15/At3g58940/PEG3-like LRR domain-containing protein n=2 Tax=Aegilops tauschii subsp. strangulata TaxID=200361 RepID=A0A453T388_AEGTS
VPTWWVRSGRRWGRARGLAGVRARSQMARATERTASATSRTTCSSSSSPASFAPPPPPAPESSPAGGAASGPASARSSSATCPSPRSRLPPPPPAVSLLKIRVPQRQRRSRGFPSPKKQRVDSAGVNSLLRAAARLEPESLEFRLPADLIGRSRLAVDLPRLDGATSIALDFASPFSLRVPAGAEFPALEALSLTYSVTDLDALLSCCPRLRTLRLCRALFPNHKCDVRVSSPSLQELVVCRELSLTQRVDIVALALKQLTMSFSTMELISSSVLAPLVEKVSWHCYYLGPYVAFGLWGISKLRLQTADRQEQMSSLQSHAWADTSLFYADAGNFAQEIKKHMVAAFSVLELHLTAKGMLLERLCFISLGWIGFVLLRGGLRSS